MKIPLAEHFHSIQGEGTWTGTPMHFVRLPGCSVGKLPVAFKDGPTLPTSKPAWLCRTWDGRPFWCDTDFNKYEEIELEQLLAETWEDHICITGGEPLIHQPLVKAFITAGFNQNIKIHIETSGTIDFTLDDIYFQSNVWITVSPKINCLPQCIEGASEIKLLVDATQTQLCPPKVLEHHNVWLSPINDIDGKVFNTNNLTYVIEMLKFHPSWRLSVQLHKYLGVR